VLSWRRLGLLFWGLSAAGVASSAHAGAGALKAENRRGEAKALVEGLAQGGHVPSLVNKLKYLGEEEYAATSVAGILHGSVNPRQRQELSMALSLLAVRSSEAAQLSLLTDRDGVVRMNALQGLGRIRSRQIGPIKPLLNDASLGVRREAARALGMSRVPRMGKVLLQAARTEGEPEVRSTMLVGVGLSGDKTQIKGLEKFLNHSSEETRLGAAQGLCLLGAARGKAYALKLLASTDRFERRQGLALFEGTRAQDSGKVLKPLLTDADKVIAARAGRILYQGGDRTLLSWLVIQSHHASDDDKLAFETELEPLRLADDQRRAILRAAGLAPVMAKEEP
jgi:HEAT repeat protein